MIEYTCQNCSVKFMNYKSDNSKYCSKNCKDIGISINHSHRCGWCNSEFTSKRKDSKFCSAHCSGSYANSKIVNHKGGGGSGKNHWNWKGGKNYSGMYKTARVNGKYKYVHRLVVEEHFGRELETKEQVHHINGNHRDNRIENLIVVTPEWHTKLHHILGAKNG